MKQSTNLITHDDIVGYDHQGWPLYHLRVISLLRTLGVPDKIIDQISPDILTMQISTLQDNAMAYGINEELITDCTIDKNKNIVYLWRTRRDKNA